MQHNTLLHAITNIPINPTSALTTAAESGELLQKIPECVKSTHVHTYLLRKIHAETNVWFDGIIRDIVSTLYVSATTVSEFEF